MKARKYGGPRWLGNALVRRHLFFNAAKRYSLDECCEYTAGMCEKWWEVTEVSLAANALHLTRRLVLATPHYAVAWDLVKDPAFDGRRNRRV